MTNTMLTIDAYAKDLRNCFEACLTFEEAIQCVGAQHSVFYDDLETLWWNWERKFASGHGCNC